MSTSESEHAIALGVLQRGARLVEVEHLVGEHFLDVAARRLFLFARSYGEARRGKNHADLALALTLLERSPDKKARALIPVVEEYRTLQPVTDSEFRDAIAVLVANRRKRVVKERATQAVEASLAGDEDAARAAMRRGLLEAEDAEDDRPEDLRAPATYDAVLADLRRPSVAVRTFDPGFDFLTERVPFKVGDLTIVAGYAKDGKTHLSKAFAYNAIMRSGARVLFASLEMDKPEIRALFIAHHATTIDPKGVPWALILTGKASLADRRLYAKAARDLRLPAGLDGEERDDKVERVEGPTGTVFLWAPQYRPTMEQFGNRLRAMKATEKIDAAVGDYLELFEPTRRTGRHDLDLTEMCYEAKMVARETRVWLTMNHQISRAGRDAAEKRKPRFYILRDLGGSSGVEKAANQVVWIYSDELMRSERQGRVGMAAARLGETLEAGREIFFDPRHAFCSEVS